MISNFMKDALNAKEKLNTFSETMCLAKWMQTSLHLTTGHTNSCYHCPQSKIDQAAIIKDPTRLHFTKDKEQQQTDMIHGQRPDSCSYCWNIEDTGQLSDRHYRSGEPWAMENYDKIYKNFLYGERHAKPLNPTYLEVNFNYACNFKCSYCSPQFSSSWEKEIKDLGSYPTSSPHNAIQHFSGVRKPIPNKDNNLYVDAFWKWWPELYNDLRHFRLTGGEPLMDKNTYKVFDYVLKNPKKDLHLDVTSNFCPSDSKLMNKYIDYVKRICEGETVEHFMQYVSVDTWGKQAEYIRHGLNFNYLLENIDRYLTEIPGRNSLTLIMTQSNLVIPGMRELLEKILELRKNHSHDYQRVWIDTPILRAPLWQSLCILPESYQIIYNNNIEWMKSQPMKEESFVGFKDYEIQRMERILTYWKNNTNPDKIIMADFFRFFQEHDRRRNTNFLETFPEMREFWEACEYYTN